VIASPCTKRCQVFEGTDVCAGCFRSLREIAAWTALTDEEQLAAVDATRARRRAFERG